MRAAALVEQRYLIVLIGLGRQIAVERIAVGADRVAEWVVPLASDDWSEAIVIVSALAPVASDPAPYTLAIQ